MIAEEHQRLVNALARVLEEREGVSIVAIDMGGTPELFDQKYRDLPKPNDRNGSIPDLEGRDARGANHLGEAETDMNAENLNDQLKNFSNRIMTDTKIPVPLHVIVPYRIRQEMEDRIHSLGLGSLLQDGRIILWHAKD